MPPLRIEYLPFRAMAETTRFILRYGSIQFKDEMVWGSTFANRRDRGHYPFDKVPCLHIASTTVAQSGSIARYAAKLAGVYPSDHEECAFSDQIFELAQEMCTINPMVNCYTGGQFKQIRAWYFDTLPDHLVNLEHQLDVASNLRKTNQDDSLQCAKGRFFGGSAPTHADFNVYHHLSNARLVEPDCIHNSASLEQFMVDMEALPALAAYLDERPKLVGIGTDPGLLDKAGTFLSQRDPRGRALLVDGCFIFDDL